MVITFANSGQKDRQGQTIWNLRGPAKDLIPGSIVTVSKFGGKTVRKVVGEVISLQIQGTVEVAFATIHPTLTVAQAEKLAKAAKKSGTARTATVRPSFDECVDALDPLGMAPVGARLWA